MAVFFRTCEKKSLCGLAVKSHMGVAETSQMTISFG